MEKSLSDRAGKEGFLEEGGTWTVSQKQEPVERLNKELGLRKRFSELNRYTVRYATEEYTTG